MHAGLAAAFAISQEDLALSSEGSLLGAGAKHALLQVASAGQPGGAGQPPASAADACIRGTHAPRAAGCVRQELIRHSFPRCALPLIPCSFTPPSTCFAQAHLALGTGGSFICGMPHVPRALGPSNARVVLHAHQFMYKKRYRDCSYIPF